LLWLSSKMNGKSLNKFFFCDRDVLSVHVQRYCTFEHLQDWVHGRVMTVPKHLHFHCNFPQLFFWKF
jgi:hypothetical protein